MDKLLIDSNASVLDELKSQLSAACANYTYDFTSQPTEKEEASEIRTRVAFLMKDAFGDGIGVMVTKSDTSDHVYHIDCSSSTNTQFIGYAIMNDSDEFRRIVEIQLRSMATKLSTDLSDISSELALQMTKLVFSMIRDTFCQNAICELNEAYDPLAFVDFQFGNAKTMYKGQIFRDLSVHVKSQ